MKTFIGFALALVTLSPSAFADSCTYEVTHNEISNEIQIRADRVGTEDWGRIDIRADLVPLKEGKTKYRVLADGKFEVEYKKGKLKWKFDSIYGEHFRAEVMTDPELKSLSGFKQTVRVLFDRDTRVDCRD